LTVAQLPLVDLYSLWFQVTGLLCNLRCRHCLVDSSPDNKSMAFLEPERIREVLGEAASRGVKEIYFTGGEPFLHRDMAAILADSLRVAPTSVLTNGTLITEKLAARLGDIARESPYSLEIRVSIDHPDPEQNDAVRGKGSFQKATRALLRLEAQGLLPIATATEFVFEEKQLQTCGMYEAFRKALLEAGIKRPRIKLMPVFRTGKLEDPSTGTAITECMMETTDPMSLQCSTTRVVTAEGFYACPILVGKPEGRVGNGTLESALAPISLSHHACRTCFDTNMTCSNH